MFTCDFRGNWKQALAAEEEARKQREKTEREANAKLHRELRESIEREVSTSSIVAVLAFSVHTRKRNGFGSSRKI